MNLSLNLCRFSAAKKPTYLALPPFNFRFKNYFVNKSPIFLESNSSKYLLLASGHASVYFSETDFPYQTNISLGYLALPWHNILEKYWCHLMSNIYNIKDKTTTINKKIKTNAMMLENCLPLVFHCSYYSDIWYKRNISAGNMWYSLHILFSINILLIYLLEGK